METVRQGERGLSAGDLMRFVDLATDALAAHREEIDALNVFPVPDGDTGTNMYLTVSAGRDSARDAIEAAVAGSSARAAGSGPGAAAGAAPVSGSHEGADRGAQQGGEQGGEPVGASPAALVQPALHAFARGALLGARGNSGVILSQILGALASELAQIAGDGPLASAPPREVARVVAGALRVAAEAAYAAVGTPVEGTILTVAREAARAAEEYASGEHPRVPEVFAVAAAAAREALEHTPDQLQVLRDAGVVDAGARGLCVILDSAEVAATGKVTLRAPRSPRPVTPRRAPADELTADGPAYEVMYLLDADPAAIPTLRATLAGLGDSLVVVGDGALWNVHVHVDDVGAAIEAGIEIGRPHRIRVTHFADQLVHGAPAAEPSRRTGRAVVAVSAGEGLSGLFASSGATVVPGGPGRRPSTGDLLQAILDSEAAEVVVLPNDNDSIRVAQIAARTAEEDTGIKVRVIPTQAQVQGLAALAVHDASRQFDTDVLEMTATASHVRHGAVTIAAKQAITMAGPCEPGDVLGVVAGDFAVVGQDLAEVVDDVLARLLAGGGELVTVVVGQGAPAEVVEHAVARLEETHPHVDVDVLDGGQDRYPLLMSVE